ncbi:acyl-CoA dehydrogenase [Pseudooceanicola sediminis]|uniref:acyl-CoA dehydrogenase n=1 Tax=Pseudooceanicola sediminis TaxID=2211117 RepID=UPI0011C3D382|nr:acyl-CoA dehydrogenase [Pseudooceanicola sediminis]
MTSPLRPTSAPRTELVDILDTLALNAEQEDAGTAAIARSVALLHRAGLMLDDGLRTPDATANRLMRIGAVNLSLGRLWEGHVNALALLRAHARPAQQNRIERLILAGGLLGVWGADGPDPVTWDSARGCLTGAKVFASGLGTATHAIITVNSGPQVRLALIDASDAARSDASAWQMPGMRATTSGRFDCDGLTLSAFDWIGGPGDYLREPHFVGGVWRIAALQLGAALGLLDTAAKTLRGRDRMAAEAQKTRLATQLTRALAAATLVRHAAQCAASEAAQDSVATSIATRLMTEELGLDTVRAVEQSLGLGHFGPGSTTLRMAQDLSVYMRQAARDAMLMRLADHAFTRDGALWDLVG